MIKKAAGGDDDGRAMGVVMMVPTHCDYNPKWKNISRGRGREREIQKRKQHEVVCLFCNELG